MFQRIPIAMVTLLAIMAAGTSPASAESAKQDTTLTAGAGGVEPQHCSGHAPHENLDPAPLDPYFTADGVNIRTYPHIGCTSRGYGYRSHVVNYFCYRFGDAVTRNGRTYYTWTYLLNLTTGVAGWVSDAYLAANSEGSTGSTEDCDR